MGLLPPRREKDSKRVGRFRSLLTGEQVGSYTAPKNTHFASMDIPSDYRVESYHRKRGNTFKGQLPTVRPKDKDK